MVVVVNLQMGLAAPQEMVGDQEPHISEMKRLITLYIQQAVIPLIAYAQQYEPWTAIISLDIQAYIRCDDNSIIKICCI